MGRKDKSRKIRRPKTRLGLPDLDQSWAAVIGSLRSSESQRGYRHAINEFIDWYCSEPRLSFNRTVVLRYRMHLESRNLAAGTINVRLAAVRRLAYEAADAGLLSPELAGGSRRVKGAKSSVFGLEIGYPQVRRALYGNPPTLKRSKASETARSLPSCSAVVFDDGSWPTSLSTTFNGARIVGPSWTSLAKAVMFEPFQFPTGSSGSSMNGSRQQKLPTANCLGVCVVQERCGATE
jgi:hypothetical protein